MDVSMLNALLGDPVIKRLTAGRVAPGGGTLPETLVARVTATRGDYAVLRWQEGNFTASLNAAVNPGEILLLKNSGVRQGRPHYRILTRMPSGEEGLERSPARDTAEPVLFGLMPSAGSGKGALPALVRFNPQGGSSAESPEQTGPPLLELFIDTERFGLVLVRFYYHGDDRLQCRFIMESREAGEALQGEASRLAAEAGGPAGGEREVSLHWSVGNLRKTVLETLHKEGYTLNRQA